MPNARSKVSGKKGSGGAGASAATPSVPRGYGSGVKQHGGIHPTQKKGKKK